MATSIKLDAELKERVQRISELKDRSSHWVLREAVKEYVTREEARESFLAEAHEALEEYQRTGMHLTGPEVFEWLDNWHDPDYKDPECHE